MKSQASREPLKDSQTIVLPQRKGSPGNAPESGITARPRTIGTDVPDAELARRMLDGQTWAKEAFYRKHVDRAYRVARRLVGQIHDTEDVVQEAFSQALVDLPQLRNPEMLGSWFLRIVVNRAHRKFRRRRFLAFFGWGPGEEWDCFEASAECSPEVRVELGLVQSALKRVPAPARTAWILRRVEGCSLDEVAEGCGCSLATAKRRITQVDDLVTEHVGREAGGAS